MYFIGCAQTRCRPFALRWTPAAARSRTGVTVGQTNQLRTRRHGLLLGLTAASLGIVYGYDISNIAGAMLFITDEFGLTTRQQELVTTAVVLGEIAGALGAGVLANLIGRKWSMVLVAVGYTLFAL